MKPISNLKINTLINPKQHFCDCYLVSSLSALFRTKNGKQILRENIQTDGHDFIVRFNNVYGKSEDYFVTEKECENLILQDKYLEPIKIDVPHNPIIKAVEVAMDKLIQNHPFKKSIISRLIRCNEQFEYNSPSKFMQMFTGIKPIVLNESGFHMSLRTKTKNAIELLNEIAKKRYYSFIAGTGMFRNQDKLSWHCYTIDRIENQTVFLLNARTQLVESINYNDIIKKFKFICGYFDEMLNHGA